MHSIGITTKSYATKKPSNLAIWMTDFVCSINVTTT